eukprot:10351385-Lingulodinium_polyedra.AAC.1
MEEKGAWETSKFIRYFRVKEAYQREGEQKVKVIFIAHGPRGGIRKGEGEALLRGVGGIDYA